MGGAERATPTPRPRDILSRSLETRSVLLFPRCQRASQSSVLGVSSPVRFLPNAAGNGKTGRGSEAPTACTISFLSLFKLASFHARRLLRPCEPHPFPSPTSFGPGPPGAELPSGDWGGGGGGGGGRREGWSPWSPGGATSPRRVFCCCVISSNLLSCCTVKGCSARFPGKPSTSTHDLRK